MFVTSLTVYSKSWFKWSVREENDTMVEVKPGFARDCSLRRQRVGAPIERVYQKALSATRQRKSADPVRGDAA